MIPVLTPQFEGESLCVNCRAALVTKGLRFADEQIHCLQSSPPRRMSVVRFCNRFDDKRVPSVYDMEQIAWQLVTDRTKGRIGFISAQEFRERIPASPPKDAPPRAMAFPPEEPR